MRTFDEVEELFIKEILQEHGRYLTDLFKDSIADLGLIQTSLLLNSLKFKIVKRGSNFVLLYSFMSYGRAIEIEYFKSKTMRREAKAEGRAMRRARKKDTRFYARNAFGSLNRLYGRLTYGLTENEISRLKQILTAQGNNP